MEGLIGLLSAREGLAVDSGPWHRLLAQAVNSGRHAEDFTPPAESASDPSAMVDGGGI